MRLSMKRWLGKRDHVYIRDVVYPRLEHLVQSGDVGGQEFSKIAALVRDRGIEVLLPEIRMLDTLTLNTLEDDGYLALATLHLTDTASIENIVKRSSTKEDYHRAVRHQRQVHEWFAGTQSEGTVPEPVFTNRKQRTLVTPFIHGMTLKDALHDADDAGRADMLRSAIAEYAHMYKELNTPHERPAYELPYTWGRIKQSTKRLWMDVTGQSQDHLRFPDALKDFNTFFIEQYLDGHRTDMAHVFAREIGDELNASRNHNIHGDYHAKNVLVNGRCAVLDWPNAAGNGFPEFDIGKLLGKADISLDQEMELADLAAQALFDRPEKQAASYRRYTKNQIAQGLLSAKRYLRRAEAAKEGDVVRLCDMATVIYNDTLRRTERAVTEEIVDMDMLTLIRETPAATQHFSVTYVPDEELEHLREQHNPYALMSQEHLQPTTPLARIAEVDTERLLRDVRGKIRWAGIRRGMRSAGLAGSLAGGAADSS